jgi:monoamine oxidase
MLDTAIVGAGVCGLALARSLEAAGHDYMLFEARARVGGRVLSRRCEQTGALFDLGPTWYWPDTQPTMAALVEELGLDSFAQPSAGALLVLRDPDKAPEQSAAEHVHGSARRLGAGMGGLVDGLARGVPTERLRLAHVLESVTAEPDHVVLHFTTKDGPLDVAARRVVLALPPRLVAERLTLTPRPPPGWLHRPRPCSPRAARAGAARACREAPSSPTSGRC